MIAYLAASHDASPASIGGFFASIAVTVAGFLAAIMRKREYWRELMARYHALGEEVGALDPAPIDEFIDSISAKSPRAVERLEQMREELRSRRNELPLDQAKAHVTAEVVRLKNSGEQIEFKSTPDSVEAVSYQRVSLHRSEIRSIFRHARISFYSFLTVALATSSVMFYATYLALSGDTKAGVTLALSGAIPGSFTAGLYGLFRSAERRAEVTLTRLDREVQRDILLERGVSSARSLTDKKGGESLRVLAALKATLPEANPDQLEMLFKLISAIDRTL